MRRTVAKRLKKLAEEIGGDQVKQTYKKLKREHNKLPSAER